MADQHIFIAGAGVVGLATAFSLINRGFRVTVVDRGPAAGESSWAGGGIVSPVPPWAYAPEIDAMVARSRSLFPSFIKQIESASEVDCEYRSCALVLPAPADDAGRTWLARSPLPVEQGRLADFEPEARPADLPAVRIDGIAQVRNPRLGRGLAAWVRARGGTLCLGQGVARILIDRGRVRGVALENGEIREADHVVVATGAWTDSLLAASGLAGLGIHPVRGQILLFHPARRLLRDVVHARDQYFIPRADGRILVGSTLETAGFQHGPTRQAYHQLLSAALSTLPALTESQVELIWTGFRPGRSGGLPAIGAWPGVAGLWVNTGHFRNGLGMAPASAEHLADLLAGGLEGRADPGPVNPFAVRMGGSSPPA